MAVLPLPFHEENNQANAGIIKQLSKFYNVNSKDIKIISGLKSDNVILLL